MPDGIDWSLTTFDGRRRRQMVDFLALPLRAKLKALEEMSEITEFFAHRHRPVGDGPPTASPSDAQS